MVVPDMEHYTTRTISVVDLNRLKEQYRHLCYDASEVPDANPQVTMCSHCANANYFCPGKLCALQQHANPSLAHSWTRRCMQQFQPKVLSAITTSIAQVSHGASPRTTGTLSATTLFMWNAPFHFPTPTEASNQLMIPTGLVSYIVLIGLAGPSKMLQNLGRCIIVGRTNGATLIEFPFPIKRQRLDEELRAAQKDASNVLPVGCTLTASSIPLSPHGAVESTNLNTDDS